MSSRNSSEKSFVRKPVHRCLGELVRQNFSFVVLFASVWTD
jgi:hypothetical protein